MNLKSCINAVFCLFLSCCCCSIEMSAHHQGRAARGSDLSSALEETSSIEPPQRLILPGNLTNLAANNSVLVLIVPDSWKSSNSKSVDDLFNNLFKLNTDVLKFNKETGADLEASVEDDASPTDGSGKRVMRSLNTEGRESRKIHLLSGMWNKPKISPLYLINGTVCRFVSTGPICTTLSTTGLLQGTTQRPTAQGQSSGGGGGSSVQFANNQQPRPAGLMADDSPELNVESSQAGVTDNSTIQQLQQQQQSVRPLNTAAVVQAARPMNYVIRRPGLNLLALRRPIRQYQVVTGRTSEAPENSGQNQGGTRRGGRV